MADFPHRPVLLVRKAERLRKETGDPRYWAQLERNKPTLSQRFQRVFTRPFSILIHEPMLIAITVYMSVRRMSNETPDGIH